MSDSRALMNKLNLTPDQIGYQVSFGPNDIVAAFGPLGVHRRGVFNDPVAVTATWRCNPCEYNYLMACYRYHERTGYAPFLIDLLVDNFDLTEHKAMFQSGSMQLQNVKGETYTVGAILIAEPVPYDTTTHPYVVDASLSNLVLFAGTGFFALTGQAATLRATSRSMQASTGIFTLTGFPINMGKQKVLVCQTGMFTLTGQSVATP